MKITKRDISFRSFSMMAIVNWVSEETRDCPESIEKLTLIKKPYDPMRPDDYNTHEIVLEINEN